jgi:hypothetical protein
MILDGFIVFGVGQWRSRWRLGWKSNELRDQVIHNGILRVERFDICKSLGEAPLVQVAGLSRRPHLLPGYRST